MRKTILLTHSWLLLFITLFTSCEHRGFQFQTEYLKLYVNGSGYIDKIYGKKSKQDYCPKDLTSALLALEKAGQYIYPVSAKFDKERKHMSLEYPNGSKAVLKVEEKGLYLRFELLSLEPRNDVDNIVWGPYKTNISKYIGEIISVARDDEYAVGIMALDDNTTSGPPCDGDMGQGCYIIHSPDPDKYPIPPHLKEGQRFRIGGDGINDVAFYSQPEEYFRFMNGNGAQLEPEYGISIALHSRDRKKPYTIRYPHFNDFPSVKAPRHMELTPVDVDFIGSAIAFYACPDELGLDVIERIVLNEGLPYPTVNGKWVKDPSSFKPDIAWWGVHDSLVSYANQLNIKAVQDEGLGEYYVNPADRWAGKMVTLNGERKPIKELTEQTNKYGIAYGLHTLTEFVQPHSSDVQPVPNDGLCTVLKTTITKNITLQDTIICVSDTSYLNERGGWDHNNTNVLKLGKELITYDGVSTTKPYMLKGIRRGAYGTNAMQHSAGDTIAKLQVNCYAGFVPGIELQDEYAEFYADLLVDGGMNYIDFDGFESFTYQGHGQYSFKRFMRGLFDNFEQKGGDYLRVMGSCVFEGNWHYMSVCNIGGGSHMYDPVNNKWGIEGKDIRYSFMSNYFPCTFGIQNLKPDWTVQVIENLQSKSIAWDAAYMLGLSQDVVEKNPQKYEIFKAFRVWENAREANVFSSDLKKEMRKQENKYHLEQADDTWILYTVSNSGELGDAIILSSRK